MKRRRGKRSGDHPADQHAHYGVGRYGWSWADIRAIFLQTLGGLLLGAVALGVVSGLISAAVTGHITARSFGWPLLFGAGAAVALTVFFTLAFVGTGMWTAYRRRARRGKQGGDSAAHG